MDIITINASITIEKGITTRRYKWKSNNKKESVYKRPNKRAALRFTCKNFAEKINKINKEKRQVLIKFIDEKNIKIIRIKKKGVSLQGYSGKHPYIQLVVNKSLPNNLWIKFEESNKKTLTLPINITLNLSEWKDLKIYPEDFILEVEKEAKSLMSRALKKGFKIDFISKGRNYDLSLTTPNKKEIIIGISSHTAKTQSRSKEKTIQKILMDISKMLPHLYNNEKIIPIIITKPIDFEKSWSFTTSGYLDFYRDKFGFKFLTTEFKKDWEDNIIKELMKI